MEPEILHKASYDGFAKDEKSKGESNPKHRI
jgi:hypothetical protein